LPRHARSGSHQAWAGPVPRRLLLAEHADLRTAALLAIAIWSFCRAYYFAFYVIQHYVDDGYRFAGLGSFIRYLLERRSRGP
jgi:hypothetical protein